MTRNSATVMIALILLTLAAFLGVSRSLIPALVDVGGNNSPLTTTPRPGKLNNKEQLAALTQLQQTLDRLAEKISNADWTAAKTLLAEFRTKTSESAGLQFTSPDVSPLLRDFFDYHANVLERGLTEQNARAALIALNQVAGIIGEHRARMESNSVALELQRLRYLTRELELWSGGNDEKMLAARATALRNAWKEARLALIARTDDEQTVRAFDELIEQLAAARQPREFAALLPPFKKQMEQIEAFARKDSSGSKGEATADNEQ